MWWAYYCDCGFRKEEKTKLTSGIGLGVKEGQYWTKTSELYKIEEI
jgi:hypothetical protein